MRGQREWGGEREGDGLMARLVFRESMII